MDLSMTRFFVRGALSLLIAAASLSAAAQAPAALSQEASGQLRVALLADLEAVQSKLLGLAEAFPQEKYSWRPMEGVRSVNEVLTLSIFENYALIPTMFGAKSADMGGTDGITKIRGITDKSMIIAEMKKAFAYAKAELERVDAAALGAPRNVMRAERSAIGVALFLEGDLHEHLGQLIAYARMNKIAPPWSK